MGIGHCGCVCVCRDEGGVVRSISHLVLGKDGEVVVKAVTLKSVTL